MLDYPTISYRLNTSVKLNTILATKEMKLYVKTESVYIVAQLQFYNDNIQLLNKNFTIVRFLIEPCIRMRASHIGKPEKEPKNPF
jgi:hypothetical protein